MKSLCVWAVFKIQGFVGKRFLPYFPSPSPFFCPLHFRPAIVCSWTPQKRLLSWFRQITPLSHLTWVLLLVEGKLTAKEELNFEIYIILKENAGKVESVFVIRSAQWAEKLGCCLEYCRSWKIRSQNLRSTWRSLDSSFERKGALVTVEICVLCGRWFSNQFETVSETPFSCDAVGRELFWAAVCSLLCLELNWNIRIGKQGYAQASQAKNTWCKGQFVYIENCMGKSPIMKKMCN